MRATTHTEVYRRFEGELNPVPLRPLVLAMSGIRQGLKRKLPMLILFVPVAITTIVNAFKVYLGFTGDDPGAAMGATMLQQVLGDTVDNLLGFLQASSFFGLLVVAWYGAGLIAEDRRLGANLLYFARPITRFGYLFGKFLTAFLIGSMATVIPCLVICTIASFSSPEWSFLKEEWTSILGAVAFASFWTATIALLVLTVSCLVQRKTHALVGIVGLVVLSGGVSEVLSHLARDARFELLGLFQNFNRIGAWLLKGEVDSDIGIQSVLLVVAALWVAMLAILSVRVKRMEVVG